MPRRPYPGAPSTRSLAVPEAAGRVTAFQVVDDFVNRLGKRSKYLLAFALIVFIAFFDTVTGPELAFSIFYLIPVAMLAWYDGWAAARVGVLASGLAWLIADVYAGATYSIAAIQYWNALVRTSMFYIVGFTLSHLRSALGEERRLARTDDLTGLPNTRSFLEFATLEIARQRRYRRPLSIAMLDCDNFKRVNDEHGHAAGDELLRQVGIALSHALRELDIVARLGGDEFVILMTESDKNAAEIVLQKITNALHPVGEQYGTTFSMGAVTYMEAPRSVDDMLAGADRLMYEVKKQGKNGSRQAVVAAGTSEPTVEVTVPA